ncbi:MAG: PAS domain S-box protein [Sedimenticola sp.]
MVRRYPNKSLYTLLGGIIIAVVILVLGLNSAYSYWVQKRSILEEMKQASTLSIASLQKNIGALIESYAINEYDKIVTTEIELRNHFAIIVSNYKMGRILGEDAYVIGKIWDDSGNIVDYDQRNEVQRNLIDSCFYSDSAPIKAPSGELLGRIDIYISGTAMYEELNAILIHNIINMLVIALALIVLLFIVIEKLLVRPLSQITDAISSTDDDGIPLATVPSHEYREIAILSDTMNNIIEVIRRSRRTLQQEHDSLEQALRVNRLILETIPDLVWLKDTEGTYLMCNPHFERLFGAREQNIVGKTDYEFTDRELADSFRQHDKKAMEAGRTSVNEEWVTFADDGHRELLETAKTPMYDAEGRLVGILGIARDITERKQAEAELLRHRDHLEELAAERTVELRHQQAFTEAVLENISDGIVACNEEGVLSLFNRATRELHGIDQEALPPDQWAGHYRLLQPDGKTLLSTDQIPLFRAFRGEQVHNQEIVIERMDGKKSVLLCSGKAMYDSDGRKIGAFVSMHDITAQKEAEAQLVQARDIAEAANRAKSIFLANMSHELRTPLTAVLGFSQLMRDDPEVTKAQNTNLEIINRSGTHLLKLINDVLDMSKIEAGQLQLELEDFDLDELVRDTTDMIRVRAEGKGLQLIFDQRSEFPRFIRGDPAKLRQILINLLSNAVKFTQSGSVTLRLDAEDGGNGTVVLHGEVQDTGSGIESENIERIFQPFEQLAQTAGTKGTGLGLAITRQFVEMMQGEVSAENTPGKGCLFQFNVLLEKAKEEVTVKAVAETRKVIGLEPGQPDYRLLIAEDQMENQLLLQRIFETVGFKVRVANNGKEAVELFQQWNPHMIWMDWRMPVMDGLTATREIRKLPGSNQVVIAAITASAFSEERGEVMDAGLDDFVSKPFRSEEMFDCMARHLGVRYQYRETEEKREQEVSSSIPPDAESLAVLPEEFITGLLEAVEIGDRAGLRALIETLSEEHQAVGESLNNMVEEYQLDLLADLIKPLIEGEKTDV